MEKRPELNSQMPVEDFRDFYWLKKELVQFCRTEGLSTQGGKIQIAQRIEAYLETGNKEDSSKHKKVKATSRFDWSKEKLTLNTVITDNYKNSENVRAFFQQHIGKKFKFNVQFMNWMKENEGNTLGQAVKAWQEIEITKKEKTRKEIAPQFEYNRYIRDFLEANPEKTKAEAIQYWNVKRSIRGNNRYAPSDLEFELK